MQKQFREETFTEFIKLQGLVWPLRPILIGVPLLLLIMILIWGLRSAVPHLIFFAAGVSLQSYFFYSVQYRMYGFGHIAYRELGDQPLTLLDDVSLSIKGFDLWSKSSKKIDIAQPIYDFQKAEVFSLAEACC